MATLAEITHAEALLRRDVELSLAVAQKALYVHGHRDLRRARFALSEAYAILRSRCREPLADVQLACCELLLRAALDVEVRDEPRERAEYFLGCALSQASAARHAIFGAHDPEAAQ